MPDAMFQQAYPLALRAARVRAAAAVLHGDVLVADREDLEQEALMASWRALPKFDPSRGSLRTFVEHVVAAHMASLGRARRCRPRLQPLDEISHPVCHAWAHEVELRLDVQQVLNGLPLADRRLAFALIEQNPTEVSRAIGVARSTVYDGIRRLQAAFRRAGYGMP